MPNHIYFSKRYPYSYKFIVTQNLSDIWTKPAYDLNIHRNIYSFKFINTSHDNRKIVLLDKRKERNVNLKYTHFEILTYKTVFTTNCILESATFIS